MIVEAYRKRPAPGVADDIETDTATSTTDLTHIHACMLLL